MSAYRILGPGAERRCLACAAHGLRDRNPKGFGCSLIDYKVKYHRLFNRKRARFLALYQFADDTRYGPRPTAASRAFTLLNGIAGVRMPPGAYC